MKRHARIPIALTLSIIAAWLTLGFIAGVFGLFGWLMGTYFAEANLVDFAIYCYFTSKQYVFFVPSAIISIYTFFSCMSIWNRAEGLQILRQIFETKFGRILALLAILWFFIWSTFCYYRMSQNHLFLPCEFSCNASWEISDWIMYFGVLIGLPTVLLASSKLVKWIGEGK